MAQRVRDLKLEVQAEQDRKADKPERFRAVITDAAGNRTGTGSIWRNENQREVWFQAWGSGNLAWGLCDAIEPFIGLAVIVETDPFLGVTEVIRDDPVQRRTATTRVPVRASSEQDFAPGGRFQLWLQSEMIQPLATYPGTGLAVNVVVGEYEYFGTRKTYAGKSEFDISSHQPAGPSEHLLVGLYLDANNTLQTVAGSTVATSADAPEPTWPDGAFRLSVVDLDDSQTSITLADDIVDRRVVWTLTDVLGTITVKNTSGATASAGDVGYIDEAGEYKTTTVAFAEVNWCVVDIGGANNADIEVKRRGRVDVNYTGADPAGGDFLVTSTSAGDAQAQTTMRSEIFAVCLGAGSGGVVSALLLTQTREVHHTDPIRLYSVASHSATDFVATINGAPTTTSVVYNAPSAGHENVIVPAETHLGQAVLHNTTRGTTRLITAVDTGTNTITTVSSSDSWADTDTIKIESQTVTSGATAKFVEIDLSQQSVIPILARSIGVSVHTTSTGAVGLGVFMHPFETFSGIQQSAVQYTQISAELIAVSGNIRLRERKVCYRAEATGVGTKSTFINVEAYYLAAP